ncbi:MAG: TetR/AcrR family transcriptional regulator [Acidimicrobiales bacterium]
MPPAEQRGAAGTVGAARTQYDVERLLAVAVAVFIERGYDRTSMEDLARATGISKSSIYHHITSKEELLRLAVERALGALFAVTEEPGATSGPAVKRLEHVLGRMVEVLAAELPYVTLLLRVRGNTETERWALGRRRDFDRIVRRLVSQAASAGAIREDLDVGLVERLVTGMINSVTEWYRPGRVAVDELRDTVVTLTMASLEGER